MKKPNTFIIGAPKCGTTSVVRYLESHPNVFVSSPKEPHFFETTIPRGIHSLEKYESLFRQASESHRVVLEASTGYLFCSEAVKNIISYNSESKFVVCIRNPFEMSVSLHGQALRGGYENQGDFNDAWRLQSKRQSGESIPDSCCSAELLAYARRCALGSQLDRLFETISRNKVLILVIDDLRSDPEAYYEQILCFLGLSRMMPLRFSVHNKAWLPRYPFFTRFLMNMGKAKRKLGIYRSFRLAERLNRINAKQYVKSQLDPDVKSDMLKAFMPEIKKLERILERDLSAWQV